MNNGPDVSMHSGVENGIVTIMREAVAANSGVLRLDIGEPDFATPTNIVEAAHRAALDGRTRYTPNAGVPELREALADKIERINNYSASPENVVVTNGGVEALFLTLTALVKPGDEILIPDPAWPNYLSFATVLHARAVGYPLRPEAGFLPAIDDLERLVTPRTKVIMLNSPSNPVGAVFDRQLLTAVIEVAARRGIWIISDECYDQITYDDTFVSTAAVSDYSKIVSVYTFSKTYAMTGWRIGYLVSPPSLSETLINLQEPILACVNTPAQYAAIEAVTGPQDHLDLMVNTYRRRRDLSVTQLRASGLDLFCPSGAFYLWLDTRHPLLDGMKIAQLLLRQHGVAVGPGPAFGQTSTRYIRLSLASSDEALQRGIARIVGSDLLVGGGRRLH